MCLNPDKLFLEKCRVCDTDATISHVGALFVVTCRDQRHVSSSEILETAVKNWNEFRVRVVLKRGNRRHKTVIGQLELFGIKVKSNG